MRERSYNAKAKRAVNQLQPPQAPGADRRLLSETSWGLNHPLEKYATVKLDRFPKFRGGHKKYSKTPLKKSLTKNQETTPGPPKTNHGP